MKQTTPTPAVHCRVSLDAPGFDLASHRYAVTLTVAAPAADQVLTLPVWIPGSYLVREFARHLSPLRAVQGGQPVAVRALDKASWQVACQAGQPLVLHYEVYAFDNSVRTAWLDAQRGFFNATSVCLRVAEQADALHHLCIEAPPALGWRVATGLTPLQVDERGFGTYAAAHYDELADCPVEMGDFWIGGFSVHGVLHRFTVAGAPPAFDGARLLADTRRIVDAAIRFWHPQQPGRRVPFKRYVFTLNAVDEGYGGLEHRNSTALVCHRRDLPLNAAASAAGVDNAEGYTTLLGLISHEYFHTWNVKRLRPVEFARYHYERENHTELLWFFEGFTSYYDDLLLRRAGLVDDAQYLKLLAKPINGVRQSPGRQVQSVAQASFDAWIKHYRPDENTPNATVSYYTKGALVALCFDLTLRQRGSSLDAVMRGLWQRCAGGPMSEADFLAEITAQSGTDMRPELTAWVHGTGELPLRQLLAAHGVQVESAVAGMAQRLGLRMASGSGPLVVKQVLRGGLAEQAGFSAGDEWLAVNGWRLAKVDDLPLYLDGPQADVLVSRQGRLVRLSVANPLATEPAAAASKRRTKPRAELAADDWRLSVKDAAAVAAWLAA